MEDRRPDKQRLLEWYLKHPDCELTRTTFPLFKRGVISAYFVDGVDTPFLIYTPAAMQAKKATNGG